MMNNEETFLDVLKWVEALILACRKHHEPERALNDVLAEVRTCITIAEFPENDGTRFIEATKRLRGL